MNPNFDQEDSVYALVVGAVIAQLREKRGWTQEVLAGRIDTTQWTLSRIERGQTSPDAFTVRRLAEAFDLTAAQLNAYFDDSLKRAEEASRSAVPTKAKTAWWKIAFATAGVAGVIGLVAFAVGVALAAEQESEKPSAKESATKAKLKAKD